MDMFLPSVPVIALALGTDPGAAQFTVTTYLLGLAAGQLAWGPLSDRYGRKPVLIAGLTLFLAASAGGAAADSMPALVLLRFAQGFGMSSGPVISRSIVRDLYAREQAAHLLARMMAVFGVVPVAAPLIGGAAIALHGWTAVFWVLSAIAVALLAAVGLGLAETAPAARPSIAPARIAASYVALLGDSRFRSALATMLLAQMGIIAFVSSSALAMVQSLHLAPTEFSVLFAAVMLGQISGGIIGSRLVARLGLARMVRLGALPFGLGALVSAVLAETFDGTTRPMAVAIALFGLAAYLTERFYFRKFAHG